MSGMRALVATAVLAGCSDPTFDVAIRYEQLAGGDAAQLAPHVATLTVSVIDAEAAGPAGGLDRDATCDDVAFGRVPDAVLEGARRASVGALDSPRLSGVPRLGAKLVVAEARDAGGRRVGGGCTPVGDIAEDTAVTVLVEAAPRVRLFAREEIASEPSPVGLVVTAAWDDLLPLPGRAIVAELHATGYFDERPVEPTSATGFARTPDFDGLTAPGPAQTVIRVRWGAEPLRVPAFVLWPSMQAVAGGRISLGPNDDARLPRSWVSGQATVNGVTAWGAAALQKRTAAPAEEVVVVRFNTAMKKLAATVVDTPGARALALFDRRLYTMTAAGWQEVTGLGLVPLAGDAPGTGPATELHAFDGCPGTSGGLLVRRSTGTTDRYYAYSQPGVAVSSGALAMIADALDPATDQIVGQACLELDGAPVRVIATRGSALGLVAWLSTGQRLVLPGVQHATSFTLGGTTLIAGVEATISGPRVASYKLTSLLVATAALTGFVGVEGVDTELATLPASLAVDDLDGDARQDVLAALPGLNGPRIQANFGRLVAGEQLASISPALPGGRSATTPVLRLEDVDGQGQEEIVVMTDEGVDVLCLDVRAGAGGMQCASAP